MLICRISKRLFLAFPDDHTAASRTYVFAQELADKSTMEAMPIVEKIVRGVRFNELVEHHDPALAGDGDRLGLRHLQGAGEVRL